MRISFALGALLVTLLLLLAEGYYLQNQLLSLYEEKESLMYTDRHGAAIATLQNPEGNYASYIKEIPSRFRELLLQKEDKYFFYHPGINPWSMFQAALYQIGMGDRKASSTITQQLVKVLLGNESNRTISNKLTEFLYTAALELYQSKQTILAMYANSVYFGNQAQGLSQASQSYFMVDPELLTDAQILQLLATINRPTSNNPARPSNQKSSLLLASTLNILVPDNDIPEYENIQKTLNERSRQHKTYFELSAFLDEQTSSCQSTIDLELNEKLRRIVEQNIIELRAKDARNAAVVVLKLPENELLALIGSPDPASFQEGYQINMALEPRPIGSTVKPFIYLKAFEKGLRPYTFVDDREYKYITAIGFPLYPKNFDYTYRGEVTLHYALSNSLNVPAVKVLEYVGLESFYGFLANDLAFTPIQDLKNYQLGIALGTLEMSLFDLSRYFTIFANKGALTQTKVFLENSCGQNSDNPEKRIADNKYVQLVNKILSDRRTGIEQFGLASELNLFQNNYALKTGTSRDFQDSWVIGYTPDFLVGVWVGNADTSPTKELSGQKGAGKIWSQTMELLLHLPYNKKTPFEFSQIKEFQNDTKIEYGLPGDNYTKYSDVLRTQDTSLILQPHDGDVFLREKGSQITLEAKENVQWFLNGELLRAGSTITFFPQQSGEHQIRAVAKNQWEETITIFVHE